MANMTAEEALDAAKGMTFEKMWALMMEDRERQAMLEKLLKETERLMKEQSKEMDRRFAETTANVDKMAVRVDKVTKNVGGLNMSIGDLVETLIASRLWEKFPQYNFKESARRIELLDGQNNIVTEVDILLVNTEWTMAVEVKREPDLDDVRLHLKRMKLLRKYSFAAIQGEETRGRYGWRCGFPRSTGLCPEERAVCA
jgi:hypothetical protein